MEESVVEPNSQERLAAIEKGLIEIQDQLKKQNRNATYYFLYGIGMALIAIGLSVLSIGAALSLPWWIVAGVIILAVGLTLVFFRPALRLRNSLSNKKKRQS